MIKIRNSGVPFGLISSKRMHLPALKLLAGDNQKCVPESLDSTSHFYSLHEGLLEESPRRGGELIYSYT